MEVKTIRVTAGRTFNHPFEQYSNLRPEVTLEAALEPGEDPRNATKALQATAEGLVEDHKANLLKSIHELQELTEKQQEIRGLQAELTRAQTRIDALREKYPELVQAQLADTAK